MPESIWVAELRTTDNTSRKISAKHGVSVDEVTTAIVCVPGLRGKWDDDAEKGLRMILQAGIRGRRWLVVLYPVEHPMGDVWTLASIYADED